MAVASPDKDFFQLLQPGIILLRPPKKAAPGERVSKYALVPYSGADFEQARRRNSGALRLPGLTARCQGDAAGVPCVPAGKARRL